MRFRISSILLALLVNLFSINPANAEEIRNWLYVSGNSEDITRAGLPGTNASGFNRVNLGSLEVGTELSVKRHSVHILDTGGTVWGWGSDGREVGIGSEVIVPSPIQIGIPERVKQIAGGDNHTLALTVSGKIYVWGWNGHGQLGVGGSEDYATSWIYARPTLISLPNGTKAKFVAAGGYQSFAIGEDNSIWGWGINESYSPLGTGGYKSLYSPTVIRVPSGFNPIKLVTDGGTHSLALGADGSVLGWGQNRNGGLGKVGDISSPTLVTSSSSQIIDVAVNGAAAYLANVQGKVYSAGYNGFGQLGNTIIPEKTSVFIQVQLPSSFRATRIFAGTSNAWASDKNGSTYAWGAGSNDGLGTGFTGVARVPQLLTTIRNFEVISLSSNIGMTFAIASNASAVAAAAEKAAAEQAAADKKAVKPVAKKKSINCLKGKSNLKVIGKNPKCPAGYKVKK